MNPTARVSVGQTDICVPRLGLGTTALGNMFEAVPDRDATAVIDRAFQLDLGYFDTAPVYGLGLAEKRLSHGVRGHNRDEYVLSTKVGRLLRAGAPPEQNLMPDGQPLFVETPPVNPIFDFSYDGAMRSLEESLERLHIDRADIVFIHDPDDYFEEALGGAYRALSDLKRQGVIRAIGVGINQAELLVRFAHAAEFDCFLLANRYTLLDNQVTLRELLPLCVRKHISLIIGGVYNSGILANPVPGAKYKYARADDDILARTLQLKAVCDRYGVPLKAAAIQFPLLHPAVASVIVGMRSVAELDENAAMMRVNIPIDLWQELRTEGLIPFEAPVPPPMR